MTKQLKYRIEELERYVDHLAKRVIELERQNANVAQVAKEAQEHKPNPNHKDHHEVSSC